MGTSRIPPEWAVQVRGKMYAAGIRSRDVARRLGKSDQWVSNILTGAYGNESMKAAIIACVEQLVAERTETA